jgi:hypothetical protein
MLVNEPKRDHVARAGLGLLRLGATGRYLARAAAPTDGAHRARSIRETKMSGVYSDAQVTAYIQQYRERFKAIETQLALISEKLGLPYENPNDVEVPAEVRELARAGKRLDAVKQYRILTGASLDVAQDVVSKL